MVDFHINSRFSGNIKARIISCLRKQNFLSGQRQESWLGFNSYFAPRIIKTQESKTNQKKKKCIATLRKIANSNKKIFLLNLAQMQNYLASNISIFFLLAPDRKTMFIWYRNKNSNTDFSDVAISFTVFF